MFGDLLIGVITLVAIAAGHLVASAESDAALVGIGIAGGAAGTAAVVSYVTRRVPGRDARRDSAARVPRLPVEELEESVKRFGPMERFEPTRRYANVKVLSEDAQRPLRILGPGQAAMLRVNIGPLGLESRVESPVPFPDDVLPREDVILDVVLSSSDFAVGRSPKELKVATGVERRLRLPANGDMAVAEDSGESFIDFWLRAPARNGAARARLSYLFRNTVLQSQRVDAELGVKLRVTTDFTLSASLGADVEAITSRPRVTIVTNDTAGQHRFTIRATDASGSVLDGPHDFQIEHQRIARPTAELRRGLAQVAPNARQRRRSQLTNDLRRIAPLGRNLYNALDPRIQDAVRDVGRTNPATVLQVALAEGSTFTLPWSFVYDIYLPSRTPINRLDVCPVVSEWDEVSPMISAESTRKCPRADDVDHVQGLLCPFGFWGFRYAIEMLASSDKARMEIRFPPDARIVIGETDRGVKQDRLQAHVQAVKSAFASVVPKIQVGEARSADELQQLIAADLPILYFLCHGERTQGETQLALGKRERISPSDLIGWVDVAADQGRKMWTDPQPLVFINACGSLVIAPEDLVNYLGAFVGKAHAAGLVGTEARVEPGQAMELAEAFFEKLLEPGATVEEALRHVRFTFLAHGNLLGLMYTPYCFADLALSHSP